jgi:hypothetical protein
MSQSGTTVELNQKSDERMIAGPDKGQIEDFPLKS